VAQCRLPFSFNIVSKLPLGYGTRKGPLVLPQPTPSADRGSVQPQPISPPKADEERNPTLTEVNPDSGSITGGVRIWLKGMDFPALLPLFARFGAAVVPTVSMSPLVKVYHLILFARPSLLPTFLPVICLPEPTQASSMLRYRGIPNQMRRSMGPASRHSNTRGIMMSCESLEHIEGHVLT